jgi:hypothetical protein
MANNRDELTFRVVDRQFALDTAIEGAGMRLSLLIFSFLVCSLIVVAPASAATYYVSASVTAQDSNDGSQAKPWKTFAHAFKNMLPGDTLLLAAGVYKQQMRITLDGLNAANTFVIKAAPGATAVLDGGGTLPVTPDEGMVEVTVASRYVRVEGLEVRGSKHLGVHVMGGHVTIKDCVVHDNQSSGVYFFQTSNGRVENCSLYQNVLSNKARTLTDVDPALGSFQCSELTFTRNSVYQNYGDGVGVFDAKKHVMRANTLYDNFGNNLVVGNASDTVIDRNFVYCTAGSGFENPTTNERPAGISLGESTAAPLSTGWTVTNNIVTRCQINLQWFENPVAVGAGLKAALVANNTLTQAVDFGVFFAKGAHQAAFENNIVIQSNTQVLFVPTPLSGLSFSHNNWFGGQPGTASSAADVIGNCKVIDAIKGTKPDDFRLGAGSPCIDKGKAQTAVTADHFGATRPAGAALDIGAHEAGATSPGDAGVQPDAQLSDASVPQDAATADSVASGDGASPRDGGGPQEAGPSSEAGASDAAIGGDGAGDGDDGCGCGLARGPQGLPLLMLLLGLWALARRRAR